MLPQQDTIVFVHPDEILYCQSDNCYTNIYLLNGKRILIVKSLTKFHKELPREFIRVNQSFLVNRVFVQCIDKKKKIIVLDCNKEVPFTISLKELLLLLRTAAVQHAEN